MNGSVLAIAIATMTSTSSSSPLVSPVSSSTPAVSIQTLVEGKTSFPALAVVQAAAASRIVDAASFSWAQRARLRGLLPNFEVSFGSDSDRDVRITAKTGAASFAEGREYGLRLRARWHLSELVFDDAELRAHRERLASEAARRLIIDQVTQLYFNRVELFFLALTPHRKLKAARLEGRIHGLTGGQIFGERNVK